MSMGDTAMNTADIAGFGQATGSPRSVSSFLRNCLVAFQAWRTRGRLQELSSLSDQGLMDIGVARGEIE
jgi:uncharacterized protein YjiS (DUF1127 family)